VSAANQPDVFLVVFAERDRSWRCSTTHDSAEAAEAFARSMRGYTSDDCPEPFSYESFQVVRYRHVPEQT
jgi:hypothetical protein